MAFMLLISQSVETSVHMGKQIISQSLEISFFGNTLFVWLQEDMRECCDGECSKHGAC